MRWRKHGGANRLKIEVDPVGEESGVAQLRRLSPCPENEPQRYCLNSCDFESCRISELAVEIIGREKELGSIQGFLDRVREASGALVLSGEAGIGKTILWEAGLEEAGQRGVCVLIHRGAEAEAPSLSPGSRIS
jgi:AAA ATPase domain